MLTTLGAGPLGTMKVKQEPGEFSSVAAVGSALLSHITVKQEPDPCTEHLQSAAIIAASTDPSDSWWREYMTLAEPKHDVAGQNEVSLLRSFKRHPTTKSFTTSTDSINNNKNTTSTSISISPDLLRDAHNIPTKASIPTTSENSTRTQISDDTTSSIKNEDCATSTGTVYVSEGIVEKENSVSNINSICSQPSTTTSTDLESSRSKSADGSSSSRASMRSSLRSVRIKEEPVDGDGACAMEIDTETALKCETVTVKEEPHDPDDPVWLGDITPEGHYTCGGDAGTSSPVAVKQDEGDIEEEEDEEEDMEGEEEDEDDEFEFEVDTRFRRKKLMKLTQSIRTSRLKSFRKEKLGKGKFKATSGLVPGTASSAAAAAGELSPFNYQCPYCPFSTCYIVHMKRHRLRHITDGALNCKRCEYTTKSKQQYKQHLIQHYQADTDSEEESDEEEDVEGGGAGPEYQDGATDQSGNKDLYRYHQPLPSVQPVIPGGPLNMSDVIIAPPETKLFEKILDLRCKYCPFFTTYRSIMNQHRSIHQAEGVMYCPQCDMSTRDKVEYKEHLERHYQRDSFSCEYCGYSTISQYLYMNHRVKHTEKTYCCDDCSYTTGFKKAFKYHRLKHSAEKLLRCKHCPFITKYRHNYRQHMATHTGKGLMFCDFCSFYSAWETNFSRHLSRHKMEEEANKLEEQARLEAEMSFATKSK